MEAIGVRAAQSAGGLWKELCSHGFADILAGLAAFVLALRRAAFMRTTWAPLATLVKGYAGRLTALYATAGGLGLTVLAPAVAFLTVFNPGLLASLFAFILPHTAFEATAAANPHATDELFFRTLTRIDPAYSAHLREQLGAHARRVGGRGPLARVLSKRFARWASFGKTSLAISAAGFIPGVGALVTTAANWVATSDMFAVSVLEPWFAAKGMGDADARTYVAAHRWVLLGFCAPFALLSAVPFAGGLAAAAGYAAAAYLVYFTLDPPGEPAARSAAQAELAGQVGALKRGAAQPVAAAKAVGAKAADAGAKAASAVLHREGPAAAALRAVAPTFVHDVK